MIKIKFDYKDNYKFNISGHANAGNYGNDLVCAAATGIVSGMLNVFDQRYKSNVQIDVLENEIIVETLIKNENLKSDFEILLIQLKTLEIQYPKNIKIEEVH